MKKAVIQNAHKIKKRGGKPFSLFNEENKNSSAIYFFFAFFAVFFTAFFAVFLAAFFAVFFAAFFAVAMRAPQV